MRLGLLGLGRIGAFHAETLAALPAVEELVISDPVGALAEQAAARFGARIAASPEAVLASGVDGVVIAAPTGLHTELIELCVAAGLPAFCEKPVSRDSGQASAKVVIDAVSLATSTTGLIKSCRAGCGSRCRRSSWQTTAAKLAPIESPPTAATPAGAPNRPAWLSAHR